MANPEHVAKLQEGVLEWNAWRAICGDQPMLSAAFLSRASLAGANLVNADLSAANLIWAQLSDADLYEAILQLANLFEARLVHAKLGRATLIQTVFHSTNLEGADFTESRLGGTIFAHTNLAHVTGLESCRHYSPSTIDYHTLAMSGPLPLPFLRGCGLPDTFIDYLPSLLQQPLQFYSCFISYSTKDQAFAERLHADLQNKGVRCWFAPHDMRAGKKLHEQIDEAIRVYDRLLLILSDASMASEWVKTEIAKARQKEIAQQRRVLFPISLVPFDVVRQWSCFDADAGKDSAREIREYFIPDFSEWKQHESYTSAVDRLLKDLKAETRTAD